MNLDTSWVIKDSWDTPRKLSSVVDDPDTNSVTEPDAKRILRSMFGNGSYTILKSVQTITLDDETDNRQQTSQSEEKTNPHIDDLISQLKNLDSVRVWKSADSTGRSYAIDQGIRLDLEPTHYDVGVRLLLGEESIKDKIDKVEQIAGDKFWIVGHKPRTCYENRGSRGEDAVYIYLRLGSTGIGELKQSLEETDSVRGIFDAETVLHKEEYDSDGNRITSNTDRRPTAVVVTDYQLELLNGITRDDELVANLLPVYENNLQGLQQILVENGWDILSIGGVTSEQAELHHEFVSLGIAPQDS